MPSVLIDQKPGVALPPFSTRRIALPTEHGGWGFLVEPLVAGLAIAFSIGGAWIALMTIGAFLTRQPLKMLILDRMGMRDRRRALAASKYVLLYAAVFAVGLTGALLTASITSFVPFLFVLPLVALQNYYDIFRRSRHIVPELAGAVAISASVACITLAGGLALPNALALWAIFVLRLISSILYVRERLLLEKGKPFSRELPATAHVLSLVVVVILVSFDLASVLTLLVMAVLLHRSISGLSPTRTKLKAMQIGIYEVIYGAVLVASIIAGHFLGV